LPRPMHRRRRRRHDAATMAAAVLRYRTPSHPLAPAARCRLCL